MTDRDEVAAVADSVRALMVEGELAEAIERCRSYLAAHPNAIPVRRALARAAYAAQGLPTALEESAAVLAKRPTDPVALWVRAMARTGLDQARLAAEELAQVVRLHSDEPRVLRAALRFARSTQRLQSRVALIDVLLRHDPGDADELARERDASIAQLAPAHAMPPSAAPLAAGRDVQIDAVYAWVDSNDPVWLARFVQHTGTDPAASTDRATNRRRYESHGEILLSLRCLDRFVPWLRHIWIVTDNQRFDTSSLPATVAAKIRFVDHRDVLPAEVLPTFASAAIEAHIHRIPGLSEQFLYLNDDMMVGAPLAMADVLTGDGRVRNRYHPVSRSRSAEREARMDRDRVGNSMAGREAATLALYRSVVGEPPLFSDVHQFEVLSLAICARTHQLFDESWRTNLYPLRVRGKTMSKVTYLWNWVAIDEDLTEVVPVPVSGSIGHMPADFAPEHARQLLLMRPLGFCLNVHAGGFDLLEAFGEAYLNPARPAELPPDQFLAAAVAAAGSGRRL